MSLSAVFVLVMSGASVTLLAVGLRRRFWTSVGALFVLAAAVYHGLSEVVTALAPKRNRYRDLVAAEHIDAWLLWAGLAILAFTGAYLLTLGRARQRFPERDLEGSRVTIGFFDWRFCFLATLPLYVIALFGGGFVAGASDESYFGAGLTSQFLLPGVVLTSFAGLVRFRAFLPVALAQSVALLLLGQRLAVVAGLLILCILLTRIGLRLTRREVGTLLVVGFVGSLVLSGARIEASRTEFAGSAGPAERVQATVAGIAGLLDGETRSALADDYIYRIDGNAFPAMILARQRFGYVGASTLTNSLSLAMPSFVAPDKLDSSVTERDEKAYLIQHYRLRRDVDFLPTVLGATLAYSGPWGLLVIALGLGALVALVDRWLSRNSPIRMVVAAGLLNWVIYYEQGLHALPIIMRGALLLVLVVWVLQKLTTVLHSASRQVVRPSRSLPARVRSAQRTRGLT